MNCKKKENEKGFILVETLIVSVFVVATFSLLFTNFLPLIGEYEKYQNYDSVEAIYIAHWARVYAKEGLPDDIFDNVKSTGYYDISDCSLYTKGNSNANCSAFKEVNNISKIYLTSYSTINLKDYVKDNNSFKRSFREYISYLPTYSKNTSKTPDTGYFRVIIEYISNNSYKYGTIELYKG